MKKIYLIIPKSNTSNNIYSFSEVLYISGYLKKLNFNTVTYCIDKYELEKFKFLYDETVIGIFMWDSMELFEWFDIFFENVRPRNLIMYGITMQNFGEMIKATYDSKAHIISTNNYVDIVKCLNVKTEIAESLSYFDETLLKEFNLPIVPLIGSRGCINKCNFCPINCSDNVETGKYITRSSSDIFRDIKKSVELGKTIFYFVDSCFITKDEENKKRIIDLCNLIIDSKMKISFYIETRVDCVDTEIFTVLKKAGLRRVLLGVENFNLDVLNRYNKNISKIEILNSINVLKKLNIGIDLTFIMFDPLTTLEEIEENLEAIIDNNLFKYIDLEGIFRRLIILPHHKIKNIDNLNLEIHTNEILNYPKWFVKCYQYKIYNDDVRKFEQKVNELIIYYLSRQKIILGKINNIIFRKKAEYKMNKDFLIILRDFLKNSRPFDFSKLNDSLNVYFEKEFLYE